MSYAYCECGCDCCPEEDPEDNFLRAWEDHHFGTEQEQEHRADERTAIVAWLKKQYCNEHNITLEQFGDPAIDDNHECDSCWTPAQILAIERGEHLKSEGGRERLR